MGQQGSHQRIGPGHAGPHHGDAHRIGGRCGGECERQPGRGGAQHPAADVGSKALAGATQVRGENQRDVIAPEAELRHGEQAGQKDARLDPGQRLWILQLGGDPPEQRRHNNQARQLKHPQEPAPAHHLQGGQRQQHPAHQPPHLLKDRDGGHGLVGGVAGDTLELAGGKSGIARLLSTSDRLCLGLFGHLQDRRMPLRTAEDLRQLLDRTEGQPIAGGEHERRHNGCPHQRWAEEFADAGATQRASCFLFGPHRALRQERPNQDQRQRRDHAGDERVAPGIVASLNRRQQIGKPCRQHVGQSHQQSAQRRERLRPSQRPLALVAVGEKFGQPSDRRHKLNTHPDEHEAAEEQQHRQAGGKPRQQRRKRIEQNAVGENATSAPQIGQVAPQQAKHTAGERRHEKQRAGPAGVALAARAPQPQRLSLRHPAGHQFRHGRLAQFRDGRLDDQRQHQQFVDVKRKAERRDRTYQPTGERQFSRGGEPAPGAGRGAWGRTAWGGHGEILRGSGDASAASPRGNPNGGHQHPKGHTVKGLGSRADGGRALGEEITRAAGCVIGIRNSSRGGTSGAGLAVI